MNALPSGVAIGQRGAAVLVLLALLGIVLPLMLAASHRLPHPEESARQRSLAALHKAREALIARAIKGRRDVFARSEEPDYRPGSLPCPDIDDDGSADGAHCFGYLGRLPYKTLEIDDLRDGAGERLWYALSPSFRPAYTPLGNTHGQLRLHPGTEAFAALLMSPGNVIGTQTRGCDDPVKRGRCARLDAVNYLEGRNVLDIDPATLSRVPAMLESRPESGRTDATFNDLVMTLAVDQFMPAVARRVAREAARCLLADRRSDHGQSVIEQAFPTIWPQGDSPCGGAGVYGYFDAWRPHIRYAMQAGGLLRVRVFDVHVCLDSRGQSC